MDGFDPIPFEVFAMPFTTDQLTRGADYALKTYQKKEPIDQINVKHKTLDWLVKNKEESVYGNGSFKEPIYVDNSSDAQNYFGSDQVTYNERDPVRWTDFAWFNVHDGFGIDEDTLLAAGIHLSDDAGAAPTRAEAEALTNRLTQNYRALKLGLQEHLAYETLRDGSQSTKATPGLAHLIDTSPATGTVGGIDASTSTYWQNNANTGITAADVVEEMEETWKDCMEHGGILPSFIPCGRAFYDNYIAQTITAVQRHQAVMGKGGATMDASVEAVNFKGIPLVWDPTFEALDTLLSTSTQTKTAYFLNPQALKLRPFKGEWMRDRKPERLPDRYFHYFGKTTKYGFTVNQRNSLAVLSIA